MTPILILFILVSPVREVTQYSPIVNDIQSQLPAGHPYGNSNTIGTVHEGTHGINSRLRSLYGKPSFYVLNNRAVTMSEPSGTLTQVASVVPQSLRGDVFSLYLEDTRTRWNHQPTYVFDEFVAYTNGSQAHKELGIISRQETVKYMAEFIPYSVCVPWATGSDDPKMKAFLRWQIERAMKLGAGKYLDLSDPDAEKLRKFSRPYFGTQWCKRVLGI